MFAAEKQVTCWKEAEQALQAQLQEAQKQMGEAEQECQRQIQQLQAQATKEKIAGTELRRRC